MLVLFLLLLGCQLKVTSRCPIVGYMDVFVLVYIV